jgi:hypothetical protein
LGLGDADRMMRFAAIRLEEEAGHTQEIAAGDILEETPIEASPRGEVPSIWPLSFDAVPAPEASTFKITVSPKRRLRGVVLGAMCISLSILAVAALSQVPTSPSSAPATPPALATPSPDRPADNPPTVSPTPAESTPSSGGSAAWVTASQPVASRSGTITLTETASRLFIDGKRITATSAIVSCGPHTVRVGWSKPRQVVVPCGATVLVDRGGRPTVR